MKKALLILLLGLFLLAVPARAQLTLLHEFASGTGSGNCPMGDLIISGSMLYGMTERGGASDLGTIFKVKTDGSGYTLLHEFTGSADDGASPQGALVISGSTLYGMTYGGGDNRMGTIFKIETDGSGFTLLHEFEVSADGGAYPIGSLTLSGSTLYGMTPGGGSSYMGTIFKIESDGTGFTVLHKFAFADYEARSPEGSLILSGSTLYGMTRLGGASNNGTIFKVQTDGSDFGLLHVFTGGAGDGGSPYGSLILSGTTLYGMASRWGDADYGAVFKIQTDGTQYSLLHEFTGGTDDGLRPYGSLAIFASTLYGMTYFGGDGNLGTIFKIEADGTQFALLHEFAGGLDDGSYPNGSLLISKPTVFGMTCHGGDDDMGVIFSLALPSGLVMTSPNGGENCIAGRRFDITWNPGVAVASVNIDLSTDGGNNWTPVVAGTANDGVFSWLVPDTPSATCRVRITSAASSAVTDSSDADFAIINPFITVTAPNGGESWQRGTRQDIAWTSADVANVKIQLLRGAAVYSILAFSTPAAGGSFSWTIPAAQPLGTDYRIRIIDKATSRSDSSDGKFSIFAPAINIVSPAAGTVWAKGTVKSISWIRKGTMDAQVRIQLYQNANKKLDIALSTENDGSYDWLIPAALAKGTYTIRITTADNRVKGKSGAFSIINSGG